MKQSQHDITKMLQKWSDGDQEALDMLMPLVYDQLKNLARACVRNEREGHTLNTTALVHEAYLKIADRSQLRWKDRVHFLAMASRVMRNILIDNARKRNAVKHGGGFQRVDQDDTLFVPDEYTEVLVELDDALEKMEKLHPRQAKAVVLYYYGGLTLEEVGEILDISPPTAMRYLRFAQAYLAQIWKSDMKA